MAINGPDLRDTEQRYVNTLGGDPDAQAAAVTRDQWQHFLDFYRPIEEEVLKSAMQTDFTAEGNVAGATARGGVNASKGSLARSLSRAGTSLTGEEAAAVGRRQKLTLAKSVAQAENTTRRGMSDSRTNLLAGMVGVGRGVATGAMSGLNSAADLAAAREASSAALKSAARSTNTQATATIVGAIIGRA